MGTPTKKHAWTPSFVAKRSANPSKIGYCREELALFSCLWTGHPFLVVSPFHAEYNTTSLLTTRLSYLARVSPYEMACLAFLRQWQRRFLRELTGYRPGRVLTPIPNLQALSRPKVPLLLGCLDGGRNTL